MAAHDAIRSLLFTPNQCQEPDPDHRQASSDPFNDTVTPCSARLKRRRRMGRNTIMRRLNWLPVKKDVPHSRISSRRSGTPPAWLREVAVVCLWRIRTGTAVTPAMHALCQLTTTTAPTSPVPSTTAVSRYPRTSTRCLGLYTPATCRHLNSLGMPGIKLATINYGPSASSISPPRYLRPRGRSNGHTTTSEGCPGLATWIHPVRAATGLLVNCRFILLS